MHKFVFIFTPQSYKKKAIYANISQFLFTFHQIPCKLGEHHKTLLESSFVHLFTRFFTTISDNLIINFCQFEDYVGNKNTLRYKNI